MFKKICSLILCLALMFTMLATVSVGAAEEAVLISANERQEAAFALMNDLGIFKEEDAITSATEVSRGLVSAIVARLLGIDEMASAETGFSDVPSSYKYAKAIAAISDLGIVNGFGDGTFAPDTTLTYTQLVKIIVVALGYEPQAAHLGGYPTGYLSKAVQLNLLDGTTIVDAPISAGTLAIIIENAINTEILTGSQIQVGNYVVYAEGSTLGSAYLGIERWKGQVTGTYFTSFRANRLLLKGEAAIDGVPVNVGTTNIESYFGMNVIAYVKHELYTDEHVVVSVRPDSRNKTYTFKTEDVSPANTSATAVNFYDIYGKPYEIPVSTGAKLIINGTFEDRQPQKSDFLTANATVKLIVPSGDSAGVVLIETYINGIVDFVDLEDSKVFFKNPVDGPSKSLVIDTDNRSIKTTVQTADGQPASIAQFAEYDVISLIKGTKTLKAILSNEKVRGTVSEVGDKTVVIDNLMYDIAPELLDDSNDLEKIETGIEAIFHRDFMGKIAVIVRKSTAGSSEYKYGYLVAGIVEPGIKKKTQIKMFTEDAEWKIFDFKDYIEFNGVKHTDSTTLLDESSPLMTGGINAEEELDKDGSMRDYDKTYKELKQPGQVYEQLVRYAVNEEGLITSLETARRGAELTEKEREKYFTRDNDMDINRHKVTNGVPDRYAARVLGSPTYMFGSEYYLRMDTKIFEVPEIYSPEVESAYKIKPYWDMTHSNDTLPNTWVYDLRLYDVDEDTRIVGAMIDKKPGLKAGDKEKVNVYADIGIVMGVSQGFDSTGGDATIVSLYTAGGTVSKFICDDKFKLDFNVSPLYPVLTDASQEEADVKDGGGKLLDYIKPENLNKGDVIQYRSTTSGADTKLTAGAVLFRSDSPLVGERAYETYDKLGETSRYNAYHGNNYFYGQVKNASSETLVMQSYGCLPEESYTTENQGLKTELYDRAFHYTGATCVLYDRDREEVRPITYSSIRAGEDYVFVDKQKLNMKWIIVYR